MAAKKVDALEEKLEMEVGSLKATIDERFNTVQQQFSSLEAMLLKLTELHLNPPLATSTGHGSVAGESSGGTEPVVGGDAEGRGQRAENHQSSTARGDGHDRFGGGEVSPRDSRLGGAFLGVRRGGRSWVAAGGGSLGLGIGISAPEWGAQELHGRSWRLSGVWG